MSHQPKDYVCEIDLCFPDPQKAKDVMRVMEVDPEMGDRVTKTFALVDAGNGLRV